jgi:hypothetical protein
VDAPTLRSGLQSLCSFRFASLTRPLAATLGQMDMSFNNKENPFGVSGGTVFNQVIKVENVPRECPFCGNKIRRDGKIFRNQKLFTVFYLSGMAGTVIWIPIYLYLVVDPVYPGHGAGVIVSFLLYFWPFIVCGFIGSFFPKIIVINCGKCKWVGKFIMDKAKAQNDIKSVESRK